MNLANRVTFLRVFLSPLFYIAYFLPEWTGGFRGMSLVLLWILFSLIELSDLVDGKIARRRKEVSDLGKLLDPFADSLSRLTYFFCFSLDGLMFGFVFLIILYRDVSVSFIRILISRRGTAMPARMSGKIKAWVYAVSAGGGLAYLTLRYLFPSLDPEVTVTVLRIVFVITAGTAIWTLWDYTEPLRKQTNA